MKRITSLFVLVSLALGPFIHAIPNAVGVLAAPPFFNPTGMRFEEYATKEKSWKQDAKLLGEWTLWTDEPISASANIEVLKLTLSAVVFGVNAEEVIVYRSNEKVQRFRVDFADDEKTTKALQTNLGVWADGDWDKAGKTIKHKSTTISLGAGNAVEFVAAK